MTDESGNTVDRPRCSCGNQMTQGPKGNGLICEHCDSPCLDPKCKSCVNQARSSREG